MVDKLRYLFTDRINQIFLLFGLFFIVFAVIFYLALGSAAVKSVTEQAKRRQLILARLGAGSIRAFLDVYGRSLVTLTSRNPKQADLEEYMANWEDTPIGGIILTDSDGTVIANAPREGNPDLGHNISDRDWFLWAKSAERGSFSVSKPVVSRLGFSKGKYIVAIASPVFKNDQFQGAVSASVILQELFDKYLTSLKFTDATNLYLADAQGTLLLSPYPELVGVNTIKYIEDSGVLGSKIIADTVKKMIAERSEGTLDIALPDFETKLLTRFILAYAPITCCGGEWFLGITTPASYLTRFFAPLYINGLGLILVFFLVLVAVSARIARSQGFREGLANQLNKDHKKSVQKTLE